MVIGLTFELNLLPSLYYPGAGPCALGFANDLGRARALEIFVIGDLGLIASTAVSGLN